MIVRQLISTFLILFVLKFSLSTDPLVIQIPNGFLKGKDNGHYYSWESIPYAEPPMGDLRFEAPQPYEQKWSQVFDASIAPNFCMQWDQFSIAETELHGEEDCLKLNIYRPKIMKKEMLPVIIFIHGGCFMFGGAKDFQPDLLMTSRRVILVKIAYRVGPLGFLSTGDENISGNFGLKDQQLAIKWVKENIENFGGDINNIMLSGFSAGGASTHLQLLNPWLKDNVKVAVSFSGVALSPWVVIRKPLENALKLADHLNCTTTTHNNNNTLELKKCLKLQKAENIVAAVQYLQNFGYNPFTTFGPVIEHTAAPLAFMTQHPRDIIKSGNYSHIPWLTSYAAQDGGYNAAELLLINPETGKEFIYDLNEKWLELSIKNLFLENIQDNPKEYAKKLKDQYLGNLTFSVENYLKVQEMYTDVLFRNGALESLKLHSHHGKESPVYGYVYNNPPVFSVGHIMTQRNDIEFGTNHMDDFTLILNISIRSAPRADEQVIAKKLIDMLINFVETEELTYDNCQFVNNAGSSVDHLNLTLIKRDKCELITEKW